MHSHRPKTGFQHSLHAVLILALLEISGCLRRDCCYSGFGPKAVLYSFVNGNDRLHDAIASIRGSVNSCCLCQINRNYVAVLVYAVDLKISLFLAWLGRLSFLLHLLLCQRCMNYISDIRIIPPRHFDFLYFEIK